MSTPKLILMVGPVGAGKSTFANRLICEDGDHGLATVYVNQDKDGKGHLEIFNRAILAGQNIIVDRLNFNKIQRDRYLDPAKTSGYETKIIVLHESYDTCLERCLKREGHETIKDEETARAALRTFFSKYERVEDSEADEVVRIWPEIAKNQIAVISDLDGTLTNLEHRRHHVRGEGKKNWLAFFEGISEDKPQLWCQELLWSLADTGYQIVYCTGRGQEYETQTRNWLKEHMEELGDNPLYMRLAKDSRADFVIKEILLDFEILTRYAPMVFIDDRPVVCRMWRKRGYTVLQCNDEEF